MVVVNIESMKPPNWFLTIAAFCMVVLTILAFLASARASHDWQIDSSGNIFDRRTGIWCLNDMKGSPTVCADMKTGKKTSVH